MASSSIMHFVYILRCADNALYIGETHDLQSRVVAHNEGRSPHTSNKRPVSMVYSESFENRILAIGRERQLKRWTRRKKEALVAGDLTALKRL
jgi:predicted GIY-YIG superfamily endonuclease